MQKYFVVPHLWHVSSALLLLCILVAAPLIFTLFDMPHATSQPFMMLSFTSYTPHPPLHLSELHMVLMWGCESMTHFVEACECSHCWTVSLGIWPASNSFLKWNLEIGKLVYRLCWAKCIQGDLRRRMVEFLFFFSFGKFLSPCCKMNATRYFSPVQIKRNSTAIAQ